MANFSSYNFKLNGAQYVKNNGNLLALTKNVVKTDSYAVAFGKIIASAAKASVDFVLTADGDDLKITTTGETGLDPSGTALVTDDLAVVVFDTVGEEVILSQNATNRIITNEEGDTVTIPDLVSYVRELSAV